MGNGVITYFIRNIGNGFLCFPQELFCLGDPKLMEIFDIGFAGNRFEQIAKVGFRIADGSGQFL